MFENFYSNSFTFEICYSTVPVWTGRTSQSQQYYLFWYCLLIFLAENEVVLILISDARRWPANRVRNTKIDRFSKRKHVCQSLCCFFRDNLIGLRHQVIREQRYPEALTSPTVVTQ